VRSFCLYHRAFDDHMIDLVIVVSSLSFVFEINVGASDDCIDRSMGGEIVALVRRLT
jgi:hypothetical protein